jgi:alanyl-tRNA synthetase
VTKDLTSQVKAGDLIKPLAEIVGGRGGGRPELAQAGGSAPDKIDALLNAAPEHLKQCLK